MTSDHVYNPLSTLRSIRLLCLEPSGNIDAPLLGYLKEVNLDDHPEYHAVSYVWGMTEPADSVQVRPARDLPSSSLPMSITPNCGQALRHLRLRDQIRPLWIDAICINQDLNSEKSQQVKMMRDIFAQAAKVVVWMHVPGITRSDFRLFRTIARMVDHAYAAIDKFITSIEPEDDEESDWQTIEWRKQNPRRRRPIFQTASYQLDLGPPGPSRTARMASWLGLKLLKLPLVLSRLATDTFLTIMTNPYFERAWTVQETTVPKNEVEFVSHHGSMKFSHLSENLGLVMAACLDWSNPKVRATIISRQDALYKLATRKLSWKTKRTYNKHHRLFTITLQATEPRDKAYAFLFAFKKPHSAPDTESENPYAEGLHSLMQVDYDKPIDTVFMDFTVALVQDSNLLPVTLASQRNRRSTLPSWVPDWASDNQASFFIRFLFILAGKSSLGDSGSLPTFNMEKRTMQVRGRKNTKIVRKVELHSDEMSHRRTPWGPEVVRGVGRLVQMMNETAADATSLISKNLWEEDPTPTEKKMLRKAGLKRSMMDVVRLRLQICSSILIPYMETLVARHDNDYQGLVVDVDVWLASMRKKLGSCIPQAKLDQVYAKTRNFAKADKTGRSVLRDSIAVMFMSLIQPFFKLWSLLDVISVVLSSGITVFVTEADEVGLGIGVHAGDEIILWERCPCPVVVRHHEKQTNSSSSSSSSSNVDCSFVSAVYIEDMKDEKLGSKGLTTFVVH